MQERLKESHYVLKVFDASREPAWLNTAVKMI